MSLRKLFLYLKTVRTDPRAIPTSGIVHMSLRKLFLYLKTVRTGLRGNPTFGDSSYEPSETVPIPQDSRTGPDDSSGTSETGQYCKPITFRIIALVLVVVLAITATVKLSRRRPPTLGCQCLNPRFLYSIRIKIMRTLLLSGKNLIRYVYCRLGGSQGGFWILEY